MNYNSNWITKVLYPSIIEDKAVAELLEQKLITLGSQHWLNTNFMAMTVNQTLRGTGLLEKQFNLLPSAIDEHFNRDASSSNLSFNGHNSYIALGNAPELTPTRSFSMAIWFKTTQVCGNYKTLMGKWITGGSNASYALFFTSGNLVFSITDIHNRVSGAVNNGEKYADGKWHLAVGTFEAYTESKLYIDGKEVGSCPPAFPPKSINEPLCIGSDSHGARLSNRNFPGELAQASLWNKALSADEVKGLMTKNPEPSNPNLLGYWPLNEAVGNTTIDLSQHKNNGTCWNTQWLPGKAPIKPVSNPANDKGESVLERTLVNEVVRTIYLNQFMRSLHHSGPNSLYTVYYSNYDQAFSDARLYVRGNYALENFGKDTWALKKTDRINFMSKVQYVAYMGQLNIPTATWLVSLGITSPILVLDYHGDFERDFPNTENLAIGAHKLIKEYLDFGFTNKGIQLAIEQQLICKNIPVQIGYEAFLDQYAQTFNGNTDQERTKAAALCYQHICLKYLLGDQEVNKLKHSNQWNTFLPLFETYPTDALKGDPQLNSYNIFQWSYENTKFLAPLLAKGQYYLRAGMNLEGMSDFVTHPDVQLLDKPQHEFIAEYGHYFIGDNIAQQHISAQYGYELLCVKEILNANNISAEAFVFGEAIALKGGIDQFKWPNIGIDKKRAFDVLKEAQEMGFVLRGGMVALEGMLYWTIQGLDVVDVITGLQNQQFTQQYNYWIITNFPRNEVGGLNYLNMYAAFDSFYRENPQLTFTELNLSDRQTLPPLFGATKVWYYQPQLLQWQLLLQWGATKMGAAVYLISNTPMPQWKDAWAFEGHTLQEKQHNLDAAKVLYNEYHFLKDCHQYLASKFPTPWHLAQLLEEHSDRITDFGQFVKYDGKAANPTQLNTLIPLIKRWEGLLDLGMEVNGAMVCAVEGISKQKMLQMSRRTFVKTYSKYFPGHSPSAREAIAQSAYKKYALLKSKNGAVSQLMHSVIHAGHSLVADVRADASARETEEHHKAKELIKNAADDARQKTLNQGLISVLTTNNDQLVEYVPDPDSNTSLKQTVIKLDDDYRIQALNSATYNYQLGPGQEVSVHGLPLSIAMNNEGHQNQPQLVFSTHNTEMKYTKGQTKTVKPHDIIGNMYNNPKYTSYANSRWPTDTYLAIYDYENNFTYILTITQNQTSAGGIGFSLLVEKHILSIQQSNPARSISDVVRDPNDLDKVYWCKGTNAIFKGNLKTKEICLIYAVESGRINSLGLSHNNYNLVWIQIQQNRTQRMTRDEALYSISPQNPDKPGLLVQGTIDGHTPTTLAAHASLLPISRLNSTDQLGVWYWNSAKNYLNHAQVFTPTLWAYNGSVYPLTSFESYYNYGNYTNGGMMLYDYRKSEVVWASGQELKRAALDGSNERVIYKTTRWMGFFLLGINPKNGEIYAAGARSIEYGGFDTIRLQANGSYPTDIGGFSYPVRITTDYSEAQAELLVKKLEQIEVRAKTRKHKHEVKLKQHELLMQAQAHFNGIKQSTKQQVEQNKAYIKELTNVQQDKLLTAWTSHQNTVESARQQAQRNADAKIALKKADDKLNREQLNQKSKEANKAHNRTIGQVAQKKHEIRNTQLATIPKALELIEKKQERENKANTLKDNLQHIAHLVSKD